MRAAASLILFVILLALPLMLPPYPLGITIQILIFAVLAMSIDLLAGFAGRTPLCHGAIFGAATYCVLYYTSVVGGSPWIALLIGIGGATALAAVFGLLAIRTSGVYFLLLTLALGMIVWGICVRWTSVTGGENGIRGNIRAGVFEDRRVFYYAVLASCAALTFAMWRFVRSPFGLTLQGIRDSESRMAALGYNVSLHLFIAFVASGFFAGCAGAMYAVFNNFVSPSTVALSQSVEGLLMAITGGIGTLFGAIVGAAAILILEQVVSSYTQRWPMVLGAMFVLIMIFAPGGILGGMRTLVSRKSRTDHNKHKGVT